MLEIRALADEWFLESMLDRADQGAWWQRWSHRALAHVYYAAVRELGEESFHYAPRPRTLEDLTTLVAEAEHA